MLTCKINKNTLFLPPLLQFCPPPMHIKPNATNRETDSQPPPAHHLPPHLPRPMLMLLNGSCWQPISPAADWLSQKLTFARANTICTLFSSITPQPPYPSATLHPKPRPSAPSLRFLVSFTQTLMKPVFFLSFFFTAASLEGHGKQTRRAMNPKSLTDSEASLC